MRFGVEVGLIDSSRHADDCIYARRTAFRKEIMLYWRSWQLRRGGLLTRPIAVKDLPAPPSRVPSGGCENCGWVGG